MTLQTLWRRGCDFLGTPHAILGGAMTWVSDAQLVSAISNSGGFGVLAGGALPPSVLHDEIFKTKQLTLNPFGVNLITLHPNLMDLIDVCIQSRVSHVVLAGGIPTGTAIKKIKEAGLRLLCFAPTLGLAKRLIRLGVDALIIEGSEAGGHIGPVSTSVLAQEILPIIKEVPVFVAGGIGRGELMALYLRMGASGCQLGTRFVCAQESRAHSNFKTAFIRAHGRDAVASVQLDGRLPVIPVRALVNKASEDFIRRQRHLIREIDDGSMDLKTAQMDIEHFWSGALKRAVLDGDVETGSLMAGQSVEFVTKEQPTAEIISELIQQAQSHLTCSL